MLIQPVILSGGAGTRLWPLSRRARPKQFLALASTRPMIEETALRLSGDGYAPPIVLCGDEHASLVAERFAAIGLAPRAVVAEPSARNTAAAAAVAAALAEKAAPGALVLLAPSDHHVEDAARFRRAVAAGAAAAADGRIVTFGVRPTRPETGFGYIERGAPVAPDVFSIRKFHEKPSATLAESYCASGAHFWNAGVFLFSPAAMRGAFERHAPDIWAQATKALAHARVDGTLIRLDAEAFAACPADSVDRAIMEKTDVAAVVAPVDCGWSDVGAWTSTDAAPDLSRAVVIDSAGAVVRSEGPLVALVGAPDMIVVATGDAVLVMPKSRAQDVRAVVEELKARGRTDLL